MSTDWIRSIRGIRLVDGTLPRIALALEKIAKELTRCNEMKEVSSIKAQEEVKDGKTLDETLAEQASDLVTKLLALDVESEHLDELVHDTMSQNASTINNGGLESQVEFLLSEGWTKEEILKQARGQEE